MAFYFQSNGGAGGGRGVSAEVAEASVKIAENVGGVFGVLTPTTAELQEAVQSFAAARDCGAFALRGQQLFPDVQLAGRAVSFSPSEILSGRATAPAISGIDGAFQELAGIASRMPNPLGFMKAILEFFQSLFAAMPVSQIAGVLQPVDLYNQAAQAAVESAEMSKFVSRL